MNTSITLLMTVAGLLAADGSGSGASGSGVLSTLRVRHPRLIVLDDDVGRSRRLIASDDEARRLFQQIEASAKSILDQPTVVHELIGPRLLGQSRRCLDRVYTLAAVYRLGGDRRFAERAEKEMLAAAAFPDWNPSHFLDTAEMSHALGVGYDWLYEFLSPASRETIRTALVEKGLKPGLDLYRKQAWAVNCEHNWNQVCNGGLTVGALAIADEEPALAAEIVSQASKLIRKPTARLKPDGGWDEGPGYWGYAMRYTAYYLAAVRSALGTDFGLSEMPGMAETGLFRVYYLSPTGLVFNYADGGAGAGNAAQMFLFSRLFDRPVYAWHQREHRTGADALDLFWYDERGSVEDLKRLPLDVHFKNVDVVFLRSAWDDPDAVFVGFKGGDNRANHSNLDLGTFVVDAMGKRWACELGADDYNMPGYFGDKRWTYYRLRTEGQNTLVIDGENQDPKARAPIVGFGSKPMRSFAIADLSAAYAGHADSVRRGIAMLGRRQVLVQDEIVSGEALDVQWCLHTEARVEVSGSVARLSHGEKRLRLDVIEPADASWSVKAVKLDPPQNPAKGISKLTLNVQAQPPTTRMVVMMSPVMGGLEVAPMVSVQPLSDWGE